MPMPTSEAPHGSGPLVSMTVDTDALLARARAALAIVEAQIVEDPTVYETDVEVLFAAAVSLVGAYADATEDPVEFVLQALEENLS